MVRLPREQGNNLHERSAKFELPRADIAVLRLEFPRILLLASGLRLNPLPVRLSRLSKCPGPLAENEADKANPMMEVFYA
jgi:hypothetical protein